MSFSRDLGGPRGETLKTADVRAAAERATAHVRGVLSDEEKATHERLRDVVMNGGDLSQNDKNTLRHYNTVAKGPQHERGEIALMAVCAQLAEVGVELMGGDAHVHFGGGIGLVEDTTAIDANRSPAPSGPGTGAESTTGPNIPEGPRPRLIQESITVTITRTRPQV